MRRTSHAAVTLAIASALAAAPSPARADPATARTAPAPAPPSAVPAPPPTPEPATRRVSIPLELEVTGRVYMGVTADARDDWSRRLGMRSARIGVDARLPHVRTVVEADLADPEELVKDAFVRVDVPLALRVQAGRFKAPFSARRLESSWRLPLVGRGLVDDYVVRRNDLGGRHLGATVAVRPWDGRLSVEGGVFVADKDVIEDGRADDVAGAIVAKPWKALEVGVTAYRAAAFPEEERPEREAATVYADVDLGRLEATVEGMAGRLEQGRFVAATALVGFTFRFEDEPALRVTPIAGVERLELTGDLEGQGHAAIVGAVLGWSDGLKVKVQGERALRPGDDAPELAVALELATRF